LLFSYLATQPQVCNKTQCVSRSTESVKDRYLLVKPCCIPYTSIHVPVQSCRYLHRSHSIPRCFTMVKLATRQKQTAEQFFTCINDCLSGLAWHSSRLTVTRPIHHESAQLQSRDEIQSSCDSFHNDYLRVNGRTTPPRNQSLISIAFEQRLKRVAHFNLKHFVSCISGARTITTKLK